ncbi:MAG: hypothetical protein QHJ82_05485 [Verrucomicrobiota bacterium]|nr:hypothetical protein [Verrucomicrobiota bacterium]
MKDSVTVAEDVSPRQSFGSTGSFPPTDPAERDGYDERFGDL